MATSTNDSSSDPEKKPGQPVQYSEDTLLRILTRVGLRLGVSVERSDLQFGTGGDGALGEDDPLRVLEASAEHAGIFVSETTFVSARNVVAFIRERFPVIIASADGSVFVLERLVGRQIALTVIGETKSLRTISRRQLSRILKASDPPRFFVCKKDLECSAISGHEVHHEHDDHGDHAHEHTSPVRRFMGLLNMDRGDIWTVIVFALVAGILSLATPLAIESLVNVVSWGTYLQPLVVLGLMLITCLGLAGVLKVLQTVLVEMIQRRQFVRIVSDLALRFPRAKMSSLTGEYPRELANRVFDIMTIQKATAVLLSDGISIVLTTLIGLVLLAFYHPFLLGFDIVLVIAMISITWLLGRGGIRTAIEESITKYRVAHWLQDVISSPAAFKVGGGESLAVDRANQLTADYVKARQRQFRVVIRQISFAIILQVVASTAVLALGGWLVIDGQLTLGQLVASELVVTTVVGAFAKAGKSLEKYYDLMAGIDKVGHLIDVETDPRQELSEIPDGPAAVSWSDMTFKNVASSSKVFAATIQPGERVALVGDDVNGRSLLARTLAGLEKPNTGEAEVAGLKALFASISTVAHVISYAGRNDLFHGTIRENVEMGRSGIGQNRVREAMESVGLGELVLRLPGGTQSRIQTRGYPLNEIQSKQLVLARAIVWMPRLLIVDGLLDELSPDHRAKVWATLTADDAPWTLIINTNREDIASMCDKQLAVRL